MNISNVCGFLRDKVYGQDVALEQLCRALVRHSAGLHIDDSPVGAFLFVGPSGCGKTHVAQMLASALNYRLVRVDCSGYGESHEVSKLIGAPVGYVGYDDVSFFEREMLEVQGKVVLLLDECEKAHKRFFDIFLQVLDTGRLTTSKGYNLSFKETIVIFTTNIGSSYYVPFKDIGLIKRNNTSDIESNIERELGECLRIEFLNRLSSVTFFRPLDKVSYYFILDDYIKNTNRSLYDKSIRIECTPGVKDFLIKESKSDEFGARELRRNYRYHVEDTIANKILEGSIKSGYVIGVQIRKSKIVCRRKGEFNFLDDKQ